MDVFSEMGWQLEVYNRFDVFDVKSSWGQVCGQKIVMLLFFEVMKGLYSLGLAQISMQLASRQA